MSIGGGLLTKSETKQASLQAVLIKADGTVQNLGVVSFYHRNKIIQGAVNAWIKLKDFYRWLLAYKTTV